MLLDVCIARKGTWLLHELPFCAQEDAPLKLFDSCIAYKEILLLHELPFCVEQDLPL